MYLEKMKNFKPLVEPAKFETSKSKPDPRKLSKRFLEFVIEVSETIDGASDYLKKNFPEVANQLNTNAIPMGDHDLSPKKNEKKEAQVDVLTEQMKKVVIEDQQSTMKNPFSPQKETEWLLQKVRGLIEKLTLENREELFNKFLTYEVTVPQYGCTLISPEFDQQVYEIVDIIYEKAVSERDYSKKIGVMLAELCKRQVATEERAVYNTCTIFQSAILNRFSWAMHNMFNFKEKIRLSEAIDNANDPQMKQMRYREAEVFHLESHDTALAITRFAGDLYDNSIINARILRGCLEEFAQILTISGASDPSEPSVVICALNLLDYTMERFIADGCVLWIPGFLDHLTTLTVNYDPEILRLLERVNLRFLMKSGSVDPFKAIERLMFL